MQPEVLQIAQGCNAVRQLRQAGACASDGQLLEVSHAREVVRELLQQGAREAPRQTGHAANSVCHHRLKLPTGRLESCHHCAGHMWFLELQLPTCGQW